MAETGYRIIMVSKSGKTVHFHVISNQVYSLIVLFPPLVLFVLDGRDTV
jgi:hypothetical protein